ncbi:MAG: alpha/beta hydrolase fold domain-containing protein [Lapillicoccus sp.]
MAQLQARPAAYDPPRRMPSGVTVTARRLKQEWPVYDVAPAGRDPRADVLFLHGGAYFRQLKAQHWRFAAHLAREVDARVVVPVYPLAPAATASTVVPVAVELAATLLTQTPARPLFLVGDSAGAGMALAVAQELLRSPAPAPSGLVLLSPWVDVTCSDPRMAEPATRDPWLQAAGLRAAGDAYRGSLAADHPWVSPIAGPLAGLPEMLVLSGTDDILTVDAVRLAEAVRAAGGVAELVTAPGQIHDYALHPTPEGRAARRRITAWMQARLR